METVRKKAKDLSVGDTLATTGMKVITAPQVGLRTPKGKCEIGFEYTNGEKVLKIWNKNTELVIVKPSN